MKHWFKTVALIPVLTAGLGMPIGATLGAQSAADLARIRDEGMNRSQAAGMFNHLTNVIGPRLTGSPGYKQAIDWTVATFKQFGLANVHTEAWPFGKGWTLDKQTIEMVEPRFMPIIGYAEAWTPSMSGEITATPVYIGDLANADAVKAKAGELRGAIVMPFKPMDAFITKDRPQPTENDQPVRIGAPPPNQPVGPLARNAIQGTLKSLNAAVILRPTEGTMGTMFVLGNRNSTPENSVPSLVVAAEHYNMIVRAVQGGVPVKLRVNVQSRYYTADTNGYNVIAEIPGTDPQIGDEVVLLGAHIDSWHSSPGATDNADAVAELLEAMRILKATGIKPKRTIRAAIWGGEEEGLLGSRAYAAAHYAGDANAAAREKLSVYLNNDPGTGPIYGWYSEGNAPAKALFDGWLAPLKDLGARRNIIEKITNTDHLAFTALGIPGFNTIQDYTDYDTRMHHTNMDFYERVNLDDLKQSAVVLATFAYQAAMRAEKFPRATVVP